MRNDALLNQLPLLRLRTLCAVGLIVASGTGERPGATTEAEYVAYVSADVGLRVWLSDGLEPRRLPALDVEVAGLLLVDCKSFVVAVRCRASEDDREDVEKLDRSEDRDSSFFTPVLLLRESGF